MKKEEIRKILPKIGDKVIRKAEMIHPMDIMKIYAKAIDETYPKHFEIRIIGGYVNDALSYSFYLTAFIGMGYNYMLFDVTFKEVGSRYPVTITFYESEGLDRKVEISNDVDFDKCLLDYIQSTFCVDNLCLKYCSRGI